MAKNGYTQLPPEVWQAKATIVTGSENYANTIAYLDALRTEAGLETLGQVTAMILDHEREVGSWDKYLAAGLAIGLTEGEVITAKQCKVPVNGLAAWLQTLRTMQAAVTAKVPAPKTNRHATPANVGKPTRIPAPVEVKSE